MDKNKIVKYDNTFNKTTLSFLTKVESDILIAVLSNMGKEVSENGCYISTFVFKDIREIIDSKNIQLYRIKKVFDTLLETKVEFFTEKTYEKGNLFSHYTISEDEKEVEIVLTKHMTDKLLPNPKEFTILDVDEYVKLPTSYSKELYRILRQFRYSGVKLIAKSELIRMIKPPKSYNEYDTVRKILLPAIEENQIHFNNLKMNVKSNGTLPDVVKFTFKPHIKSKVNQDELDSEAELLAYVKANSNNRDEM